MLLFVLPLLLVVQLFILLLLLPVGGSVAPALRRGRLLLPCEELMHLVHLHLIKPQAPLATNRCCC